MMKGDYFKTKYRERKGTSTTQNEKGDDGGAVNMRGRCNANKVYEVQQVSLQ